VSAWAEEGIDPGEFSRTLVQVRVWGLGLGWGGGWALHRVGEGGGSELVERRRAGSRQQALSKTNRSSHPHSPDPTPNPLPHPTPTPTPPPHLHSKKQNLREAVEGATSPRTPCSPASPSTLEAFDARALLRQAQMATFKPGSATILFASLQPRSARPRAVAAAAAATAASGAGGEEGSTGSFGGGGWREETDANLRSSRSSSCHHHKQPPQPPHRHHHGKRQQHQDREQQQQHQGGTEGAITAPANSGLSAPPPLPPSSSSHGSGFDLHISNLGDCGVRIVRDGCIVLSTAPQQHDFNLPYQMSHPKLVPETDRAESADLYVFEVEEGDGESLLGGGGAVGVRAWLLSGA